MIKLKKLSKKFDGKIVVNGLDLNIKPSEIVGLLGPNGAGKTTTLRMLAGVLPPSSGIIEINDKTFENNSFYLKQQIGFLPENNPLYEEMTVEEYLKYWVQIKNLLPDESYEAIKYVVASCGLETVFFRPISELSKGYRQRVGLAQAILTKPKILILDEPTEGLDPNQRTDISNLIKELRTNRTVIISSHVLSEIARIADRLLIIHEGKLVADDTPKNLGQWDGKIQIEVEIKGKEIKDKLQKIPQITKISKQSTNKFILETNSDIREQIFDIAVKNKWKLLTLNLKDQDLETVFAKLTS